MPPRDRSTITNEAPHNLPCDLPCSHTPSRLAADQRIDAGLKKVRDRDTAPKKILDRDAPPTSSRSQTQDDTQDDTPADEPIDGGEGDESRLRARKLWPLTAGTRRVRSLDSANSHLSRRNVPGVVALLDRELEEQLTSLVMQMVLQQ